MFGYKLRNPGIGLSREGMNPSTHYWKGQLVHMTLRTLIATVLVTTTFSLAMAPSSIAKEPDRQATAPARKRSTTVKGPVRKTIAIGKAVHEAVTIAIHKDKAFEELFLKTKDGEMIQLTAEEQSISSIYYHEAGNQLYFAQSTRDSKAMIEKAKRIAPVMFGPGRFSGFRICVVDLNSTPYTIKVLPIEHPKLLGDIHLIGFDHTESRFWFQTKYGYLFAIDTTKEAPVAQILPQGEFLDDPVCVYGPRLSKDRKAILFRAASGYRPNGSSFVYNTYRMLVSGLDAKRVTNQPFRKTL